MIRFRLPELLLEKQRREERKITWKDVGDATGISRRVLANMASPARSVVTNTAYIEAVCRYFRCEISDLIVFDPPISETTTVFVDELYPDRKKQ